MWCRRLRIIPSGSTVAHRMMWSPEDILIFLYIVVAVMLIIVLYHVLFIVVDVRKVMRRVETVSNQVEEIIMKPLTMTDKILEWVMEYIEALDQTGKHKKKEIE